MDKIRICRVSDSVEVEKLLGDLSAPEPIGWDQGGFVYNADELRAWRTTHTSASKQSETEGKQ